MPRPALAVTRRGEQAVHHFGEGVGRIVVDEGLHFFRCRQQAGKVERGAADQRDFVGRGRGVQTLLLQLRENEGIDIVSNPVPVFGGQERAAW